jgi:hypothetical protein
MGLLKFILYFILVVWTLRILVQLLLPVLFKRLIKKAQQQAQQAYSQPKQNRQEGSIHIDHMPPKRKKGKADAAGEFVDFEEIK